MREKQLYQKFKKAWSPNYIHRIETKSDDGIPDILIVDDYVTAIFIELKSIQKKFKHKKIPLRTNQVLWLMKYPGFAYILIAVENEYFLFHSQYAKLLKDGIDYSKFEKKCELKSKSLKEICSFVKDDL